jgi:D-arabinose 1-dehydrogenase-like Zn-dependent alcohol dehydrogenase
LPLVKKGILLPPQIKTIELKDAIDAYKDVANGKAKTKLVIKMPLNN